MKSTMRSNNQELMSLSKIQKRLFTILQEIDTIFMEHEIPYVLSFGTLLGAVRHKGFIPWDDDLDLHIPEDYFDTAMMLLKEKLKDNYYVTNQKTDSLSWDIDARLRDKKTQILDYEDNNGLFIDFFKIKKISKLNRLNYTLLKKITHKLNGKFTNNNPLNQSLYKTLFNLFKILYGLTEVCSFKKYLVISDRNLGGTYKQKDVYPFVEVTFCGKSFKAPKNYHFVLKDLYKNYMVLPNEQDRAKHFTKCIWKG
ncbi:lipopolysaccharide cholinephosphotransferase [Amphibacillus marinus]|uniref:Lipopolysaccharide cholinephosphotransferase n=1 Tax=Amphibacillus marinus TaxID=872970 RepID=A0A1H8QZG3_9BACI|nr:LicD family protein [Amphibacillus marinus]SEO59397.1 lipopolysaccharide cholinephosphotransferase [Amphibacillus marinus]